MPAEEIKAIAKLPLSVLALIQAREAGKKLQVETVPAEFEIREYCGIRHYNGSSAYLCSSKARKSL